MSEVTVESKYHDSLFLPTLILSLALIVCTVIGTKAFVRVKGYGQTISVTGSASKPIRSNRALWEGSITVSAQSIEGERV